MNSQSGGPASATTARPSWPALPLAEWHPTRDTLHLWTQIVGKVWMANEPLVNHWWNVTLCVAAARENPGQILLEFLQSTYEAAANCASWDRAALERHG